MDTRPFQPFSPSHWLVLGFTLLVGALLIRWFRRADAPAAKKQWIRDQIAIVLIVAVALDPVLAWLRYHADPSTAWQIVVQDSLPLHLCDVVSLLLAWALATGDRYVAEVGYFWSVAATTQGLLTPTLPFDWHSPEFYAFFAQHGGAPVAGMLLAFGIGLSPQAGYFKRMVIWSWAYLIGMFLLNLLLGTNYGFINGKPTVPSLLDHLGPWPWYLIPLQIIGFSFYLILGEAARFLSRRFPLPATTSRSAEKSLV
jgi:hypothetical integral membrane protein (TIGR02206 family)